MNKRRKKEREDFWVHHVKKWQEGKLTQAEYCRQHKLSKDRFSHWKRILEPSNHKEANQFVELLVQSSLPIPDDDSFELTIKDIFKLKLSRNFNPDLLKKIIWIIGADT